MPGPSASWKTVENAMTSSGKVDMVDKNNEIGNLRKLVIDYMST